MLVATTTTTDWGYGDSKDKQTGIAQNAITTESNLVSDSKKINDYVGFGLAPVEYIPGTYRLGTANHWFSPKYYANWKIGNQYTKVTAFSKLGKEIGYGGAALGLLLDVQGVRNYYNPKYGPNSINSVSPAKARLNTGMSAYGLRVSPIPALLYNGIDTFYPGGWGGDNENPGWANDQERLNQENKSINPNWQIWIGAMKI